MNRFESKNINVKKRSGNKQYKSGTKHNFSVSSNCRTQVFADDLDPDDGDIRYEITSNKAKFSIDQVTGVITCQKYEEKALNLKVACQY